MENNNKSLIETEENALDPEILSIRNKYFLYKIISNEFTQIKNKIEFVQALRIKLKMDQKVNNKEEQILFNKMFLE